MRQAISPGESQCEPGAMRLLHAGTHLNSLHGPCLPDFFGTGQAEPLEASCASWVPSTSEASSELQYHYFYD